MLGSKDSLVEWQNICVERITGDQVAPEDNTDISGAIRMAAESFGGAGAMKILVLVSDFDEDLTAGETPIAFELEDVRVILLYRAGSTGSPRAALSGAQEWERRLSSAGALHVCRAPIRGFRPAVLLPCLIEGS